MRVTPPVCRIDAACRDIGLMNFESATFHFIFMSTRYWRKTKQSHWDMRWTRGFGCMRMLFRWRGEFADEAYYFAFASALRHTLNFPIYAGCAGRRRYFSLLRRIFLLTIRDARGAILLLIFVSSAYLTIALMRRHTWHAISRKRL